MSDLRDFTGKNKKFTGNEGITVPSGTTAERGSTTGQWRYNTDTGFFEGRNTDGTFSSLEPTPTIISTDVTEIDSQAGGNTTIRITGTNFTSGGTVKFIGSDASEITASSSTFVNSSNYDAVVANSSFDNDDEPYDVRFISASGIQATLEDQINVDSAPAWDTASGNIGSVEEGASANFSVSATDPDGDTVAYSETTSVLAGAGFSLNSSTGAITGTAASVNGDTTNTFTLRATANSKTADRIFNIITTEIVLDGTTSAKAATSANAILSVAPSSTNGWYYIKPSGYGGSAFQVYCDFTTAGGGWMHVATIHDNSSDLNNTSNNPWSYGLHRTSITGGSITHDNNAAGYWGSTSTLNSGSTGSGTTAFGQDYKDTAYNEIPFTKILMKDQGATQRNLWYTTSDVPNAATYASSAQNWFSSGGRSGNVWQSSGETRNSTSAALRLGVTNFGNNDDVFGSSISNVVFFFGEPSGTDSGNQDRSMITSGDTGDSVSTTQGLGVSRAYDFSSQVWRDIDPTYADEPTSNSTNYSYSLWVR